jgi:hypothetical protein
MAGLSYQIETPGVHAPEAVDRLARMLGHEQAPDILKLSASLALVRGSKGYYSVRRPKDGYWQCSCKAAQFGKRCKHLKALSDSEKPARKSSKAAIEGLDPITRQGIATEESLLPKGQPFRPTLEAAQEVA